MLKTSRLHHRIYKKCAEYALSKGIIIADTKFEFGLDEDGNMVLGDEMLTPDSSRFWPADEYEPGHGQPSFDKQFARDWLKIHNLESKLWKYDDGTLLSSLFLVEMLLHTILCRKELKREDIALEHANEMNLKLVLIMDLLQIPLSLVFTRFLNVFGAWIPDLKTDCADSFAGTFARRFIFS